jgi:hypothetical protein
MKTRVAVLLLFLSSTPANSFANAWVLMTPDFTIIETEITRTKKWVALESFATVLQCNDHRSSLIRQIDKERREIRDSEDHNVAAQKERELRLLWHTYTNSKCVVSLTEGARGKRSAHFFYI